MIFNCSNSLNFFGVSCELSCDYNLPLEGVDKITCEKTNVDEVPTGIWQWGSGGKPNCTGTKLLFTHYHTFMFSITTNKQVQCILDHFM